MIDQLMRDMQSRIKKPRPDEAGPADLRPSTPKQQQNAIRGIAMRFSVSEEDAYKLIEARDRFSGYWYGTVGAAQAIMDELREGKRR